MQLTGRANYEAYGAKIGYDLAADPDAANAPEIAALLLAVFLADKADAFRAAVAAGDLAAARKLVNGGSHGLTEFMDTFNKGTATLPH